MSVRVMIVEDEALVALMLEDALLDAGFDVPCVADRAAPALAFARQQRVDLAVIDVRLAGGDDGIDLAEQLAAHYADAPPVILFATGNPALVRERARVGQGCLTKPFDVAWLVEALADLYAGRRPTCPGFFSLQDP